VAAERHYTLNLFDMTHYLLMAQIPFSTTQGGLNKIGRFLRWGTNGIALQDRAGNIYLISDRSLPRTPELKHGSNYRGGCTDGDDLPPF